MLIVGKKSPMQGECKRQQCTRWGCGDGGAVSSSDSGQGVQRSVDHIYLWIWCARHYYKFVALERTIVEGILT
jgi:hypothetical protein